MPPEARLEELSSLLMSLSQDLVFIHPLPTSQKPVRFLDVNDCACQNLGYTREEMLKLGPMELTGRNSLETPSNGPVGLPAAQVAANVTTIRAKNGQALTCEIRSKVIKSKGATLVLAVGRNRTESMMADGEREITLRLLSSLSSYNGLHDLLSGITRLMCDWSGCEAVGIRLQEGEDYPYFETRGFPARFVRSESKLCEVDSAGAVVRDSEGNACLECMCGNVIRGRFNPDLPFFTEYGSFWTNSTTDLLASTSEADRQSRTRNRCNGEGYESVALIPLRHGGRNLGLLQFNDRRRGRFDRDQIALLERLTANLARGLAQRQAAEALRENEERYRMIVENASEGIWAMDGSFATTFVNPTLARMLGYDPAEMLGRTVDSFMYAEDLLDHQAKMEQRIKGRDQKYERRFRRKDGSELWTLVSAIALKDENGAFAGSFAMFTDITEHKLNEEKLKSSEEKYRALYDNAPLAYQSLDEQGNILDINPTWLGTLGFQREEVIGKPFSDFLHPEWEPHFQKNFPEFQRRGYVKDVQFKMRHKLGHHLDVSFEGCVGSWPDGSFRQTYCVFKDITEQKRAEQALRESETLFRELFNNMSNGVAIYRAVDDGENFVFKDLNRAGLESVGMKREEIIGRSVREVFPGVEALGLFKVFQRVWKTGRPENHPASIYQDEKLKLWVENYVCKLPTGDVVAIYEDTTKRMEAEQALANSEARLQMALDSVSDALWDWRVDTGEVYFSSRWYTMLGYAPGEMPPAYETWQRLVHPEDLPGAEKVIQRYMQSGNPFEIEFRMRTKDGGWKWVLGRGKTVERDARGNPIRMLGTHVDITERKMAEEQRVMMEALLAKAQKMDALGTLSSGIAHDFNNILAAIMGYAELALGDLPADHSARYDIAEITKASVKAKDLVRQILTFSRKAEADKKPISLNSTVREAVLMLERTIPKMIRLELNLEGDIRPVKADPRQMEQIILNLTANAADAIDGRGSITITTKNIRVNHRACEASGKFFSGDYVMLSVRDSGGGMSPETKSRIFDPFFTTKELGKGTGLGLSTVYGIITGHSGHIMCHSQQGVGTDFQVYLPVIDDVLVESCGLETSDDGALRGEETILVVDDEASLREIASKVLTRYGYTVLQAASGEEALDIYQAKSRDIHGVIMDLGMPGMGGKACLPALCKINPKARVLIASGYIQYELSDELQKLGAQGMVSKPYRKKELLRRLRELLDSE